MSFSHFKIIDFWLSQDSNLFWSILHTIKWIKNFWSIENLGESILMVLSDRWIISRNIRYQRTWMFQCWLTLERNNWFFRCFDIYIMNIWLHVWPLITRHRCLTLKGHLGSIEPNVCENLTRIMTRIGLGLVYLVLVLLIKVTKDQVNFSTNQMIAY